MLLNGVLMQVLWQLNIFISESLLPEAPLPPSVRLRSPRLAALPGKRGFLCAQQLSAGCLALLTVGPLQSRLWGYLDHAVTSVRNLGSSGLGLCPQPPTIFLSLFIKTRVR